MNGISPIEINGMVGRTQDFTAFKHNDDVKPVVDQTNFQAQVERNVNDNSTTVKQSQQSETNGEGSGSSSNPYAGDGGRNRKKKNDVPSQGRVLIKRPGGFDVSI